MNRYSAVVMGVSTGGVDALARLLGALPPDFPLPLLIVHHRSSEPGSTLASLLGSHSSIRILEAEEGQTVQPGSAYLAPPNYHLLVEKEGTLALSVDPPVNFARPSVDVLFESAAAAFGPALIGVILTGAGSDGAKGLKRIKERGGLAIVQDPADAEADSMPRNALANVETDHCLPLAAIAPLLCALAEAKGLKEPCP